MDNIFPNIKQEEKEQIIDYLLDQRWDRTMIAVSNNSYFAAQCDRIIIIKKGKIVFEGTYDQVCKTEHFPRIFQVRNSFFPPN